MQVFYELKNRGVEDVFIAVRDGLKGLPETINTAPSEARAKDRFQEFAAEG